MYRHCYWWKCMPKCMCRQFAQKLPANAIFSHWNSINMFVFQLLLFLWIQSQDIRLFLRYNGKHGSAFGKVKSWRIWMWALCYLIQNRRRFRLTTKTCDVYEWGECFIRDKILEEMKKHLKFYHETKVFVSFFII